MPASVFFRSLARLPALALVACAAAGLLLLACAGCYSSMRKCPKFEERRGRIVSMAVMPPDVQVVEHAFDGSDKRLHVDEDQARSKLASFTATLLDVQGIAVRLLDPREPALKEGGELRQTLTKVHKAFGREMGKTYRWEMLPRARAFKTDSTLGPGVKVFAERADADGLLFIRMRGLREAKRQRSLEYLHAIALADSRPTQNDPEPEEEATVQVGLVEGTTGDVIWSSIGRSEDLVGAGMEETLTRMIKGIKPEEKNTKEKKDEKQEEKQEEKREGEK